VKNAHTSSKEDNSVLIYALVRRHFVHPIFPISSEWKLEVLVTRATHETETYTLKAKSHDDCKVRGKDEAYKTPDCGAEISIWKYATEK
jgi:hypothetical protein